MDLLNVLDMYSSKCLLASVPSRKVLDPKLFWNVADKWHGVAADIAYPYSFQGSKFCEALVISYSK